MKANKFFIGMASLVAAMTLTACSQDEAELQQSNYNKGNVISLTYQLAQTRAASDPQTSALSTSNKVGVFVTSGSATITNGNNNEHSVGAAGALTTSNTMNYPTEDGAKVNIYAYAPYASGMALSNDNNFSISTDQSAETGYLASDLVYASKTDQASSETAVALNFAHKLSQLQITIQNDANVDLSSAVVTVTGTKIATTFNPSTGAIGDASGDATDIKAATISAATTVYAIVVPQNLAAETELVKITTSDKAYVAKLSSAATLAAGKAHSFTVKLVEATTPVVEVPVSLNATSITEWGTPTSLGEADMEEAAVEPLYATFGTPGSNATYTAETFTYAWTGSTSNLMNCFTFANGELANYTELVFKISELTSGQNVRINFCYGDGSSDNINISSNNSGNNGIFGSSGDKTISMTYVTTVLSGLSPAKSLSDVKSIRFGGATSSGSVVIKASEMYLH